MTGTSAAPGKLTIGILLPTPGTWKLFLQAKPDGRLVTSSWDRTIKLWNVADGKEMAALKGHRAGINTVAWHPEGHLLASGSLDGTIGLWDMKSFRLLRTLAGHDDIWNPVDNTAAAVRYMLATYGHLVGPGGGGY